MFTKSAVGVVSKSHYPDTVLLLLGRPSEPVLSSEMKGLDSYSHELTWHITSHYPIIIHEIVYWESDKVSIYFISPHLEPRSQ